MNVDRIVFWTVAALAVIGLSMPVSSCPTDELPKFGPFITPPRDSRVVLEVRFHTPEETREICRRLSQWPGQAQGAPACVSNRFTPGVDYLHVAYPEDWDDFAIIFQIGHEILHGAKAQHR